MPSFDLERTHVRELNERLHNLPTDTNETEWTITNPLGRHAIATGLDIAINLEIDGHVGYYCGGMNKQALITIRGNAGQGLAENIMSGTVRCIGNASQSAAASGHGGLVVVEGDASSRCGISMKG
ncbi:MAG: protein glxC, partial [Pseudomonadota bacterium]|nr:protein glxC [Pseudomonadota bacterium]